MAKFDILKRAIKGEYIKLHDNIFWGTILKKLPQTPTIPVIVSLTSYGYRVENIVPFTILSILKQTRRPEKIILWLDDTNWNANNIPVKLKDLQKYGLEVRFCQDIRSYTKLIPTLLTFPNHTVVTVDDDMYYSSDFLEEIYSYHLKYPDHIITENFCYPTFNNGRVCPYREWKEYHQISSDKDLSPLLIFPQGFGGVLYPPNSLGPETLDRNKFMKLAPLADDIWFYVMEIKNLTKKKCVLNTKTKYYFLDLFRQIKTRDRLHDVNVGESQNDIQLKQLLQVYKINLADYE